MARNIGAKTCTVLTRQIEDVRNVRSEDSNVAKKKGNKMAYTEEGKAKLEEAEKQMRGAEKDFHEATESTPS